MDKGSVTIVIPAYNEEGSVAATVSRISEVLKNSGWRQHEIIVVNDGSNDATSSQAQNAGATVLTHPHNVGYGRSLKDGIHAASSDIVVITDADATYPSEIIPALLEEFKKGFDMVVGQRKGAHYEGSWLKKGLRWLLRRLVEFTTGRKIPDINSGLRVFSKNAILPYFPRLCDTFSFTTSLTLAYMMTGRFVAYVPIDYRRREGRSKVRMWSDSLRTLQFIVEAIMFYNPIKIFLLFSAALIVLSAAGFCLSAFWKLLAGYLLGIGALLLSILMFGLGLLAILLKQIMHGRE